MKRVIHLLIFIVICGCASQDINRQETFEFYEYSSPLPHPGHTFPPTADCVPQPEGGYICNYCDGSGCHTQEIP